jgi:hypothetical protein
MTRLPLEHHDGGVRRGLLISEAGPAIENGFAQELDALATETLNTWKEGALRVLTDAGLPVSPEDHLWARLKDCLKLLTEEEAAAELVDAVNDALRRDTVTRVDAMKLSGAYHKFVMLHFGINDAAAHFAAGPREAQRKADERVATAAEILGPLPVYWRDPGDSQTVKAEQDALRKALLEKGLIDNPNQVNRFNLRNWQKEALEKGLIAPHGK